MDLLYKITWLSKRGNA